MGNLPKESNPKYKRCKCPIEYWEVIIYDRDEDFNDISTIRYHCDFCGYDFVIKDMETGKTLYEEKLC